MTATASDAGLAIVRRRPADTGTMSDRRVLLVLAPALAGMAVGGSLEVAASRRAGRELSALVERAPTQAHRRIGPDITDVMVDDVRAGDVVVVRAGDGRRQ